MVNSTHHNAALPFNLSDEDYEILGWTENMLAFHLNGEDKELNPPKECEVVFYPQTNCLGVQFRPEFSRFQNEFPEAREWTKQLLEDFLTNEL